MELLIATGNRGKIREYETLLAGIPLTLLSPADVGLADFNVVEDGETFEDNARLKARAYATASGKCTLADDSGLCVDALNGAPGVYSARYGGDGLDDTGRRHKLLAAIAHVPDPRTARFECTIALVLPESELCFTAYGACNGTLRHEDADGPEGFGYDAIFVPDGYDKTFAQLPKAVKNKLSHRGVAARELYPILERLVQGFDES